MKNRWGLRLIGLLAVSCVAMSGVSLAVEPGSATDPLITLSYLNETFMGQIMDRVDQKIAQRNSGLGQSGAGMEFSVATLSRDRSSPATSAVRLCCGWGLRPVWRHPLRGWWTRPPAVPSAAAERWRQTICT